MKERNVSHTHVHTRNSLITFQREISLKSWKYFGGKLNSIKSILRHCYLKLALSYYFQLLIGWRAIRN